MQKLRAILGGSSPIATTALLSILVLGGVATARVFAHFTPTPEATANVASAETATATDVNSAAWQQEMLLLGMTSSTDANPATSTDHLALIGPMVMGEIYGSYAALREQGNYTDDDLRNAAVRIAEYVKAAVSYEAFQNSDFRTDSDVSTERVRTYRDDLLIALKPIESIPRAEYEIYGHYVETGDQNDITLLKSAASAYRAAAMNGSGVTVPSDAVNYHRNTLNALRAFASVLDGLADHADDPFASVALLRTYNEKEQGIHDAYDMLRSYYAKKSL